MLQFIVGGNMGYIAWSGSI